MRRFEIIIPSQLQALTVPISYFPISPFNKSSQTPGEILDSRSVSRNTQGEQETSLRKSGLKIRAYSKIQELSNWLG